MLLGRYVHRSRYLLDISQARLAEKSGVSQSVISRLEHARAPATRLDRFLLLTDAFGRVFPLGSCPHDHPCAWQPIRLPPPVDRERQRLQELLIEHGLDYGRPGRRD